MSRIETSQTEIRDSDTMPAPLAFPLLKLGVLVVKQISRPLASRIAKYANKYRVFSDWICIPLAQLVHRAETKVKLASMGITKVTKVPQLKESDAMQQVRTTHF